LSDALVAVIRIDVNGLDAGDARPLSVEDDDEPPDDLLLYLEEYGAVCMKKQVAELSSAVGKFSGKTGVLKSNNPIEITKNRWSDFSSVLHLTHHTRIYSECFRFLCCVVLPIFIYEHCVLLSIRESLILWKRSRRRQS
jgi:hypothetical protein